MKYGAWLETNKHYKSNLINKLTLQQYNNFLQLFFENKIQTEQLLFKKLFNLFDSNNLGTYNYKQLIKLNNIANHVGLEDAIRLFNKINYQKINKYNAKNLLLYLNDEDKFKCGKINIDWGPGNHGNINNNIAQHFIKHVLSEEGEYWKTLLTEINYDNYKKYAIDAFYKMKNVIVHSNGFDVYMSGFYGNIFIIGRYHKWVFGISSCYYVESGEKHGRFNNYCFGIDFF